jgi:purine-nucleoside phosphorylase
MIIILIISTCFPTPLIGPNDERIGARFPDMGEAYDKKLIEKAHAIADKHNI